VYGLHCLNREDFILIQGLGSESGENYERCAIKDSPYPPLLPPLLVSARLDAGANAV
jgi:hypothetical protein